MPKRDELRLKHPVLLNALDRLYGKDRVKWKNEVRRLRPEIDKGLSFEKMFQDLEDANYRIVIKVKRNWKKPKSV